MTEINYSALVRELLDDYFERRLSRYEYLARRRALMDRIDREFNGDTVAQHWFDDDLAGFINQPDTTAVADNAKTIPGERQRAK